MMLEVLVAMVQAAPNRTDAEVIVLEAPRPAPASDQVEFEVELVAAHAVPGQAEMLGSHVGQRLLVRARREWLPDVKAGARIRLLLEFVGPGMPLQLRPGTE
jgi:hypothetical protein